MPGRINPVIPEVVSKVAYEVIGNDITIAMVAETGQLQPTAVEPTTASTRASPTRKSRAAPSPPTASEASPRTPNGCVPHRRAADRARHSLNPHIGHASATAIALESLATGKGVAELVPESSTEPTTAASTCLCRAPLPDDEIRTPNSTPPKDSHDQRTPHRPHGPATGPRQ
jgi:aspartate ammonia-lyase